MKYIITLLIIFVSTYSNSQTVKLGDNIQIDYRKIVKPYFFKAPNFTEWVEGSNMFLIGEKPNPNDCEFLFLALHDTTLIGIFKTSKPNTFIFDTEGDSILNTASEYFLLPLWTVKRNARIDSTDKKLLYLLNEFYETTLQADDGQPDAKIISEYERYKTDTTLANRHIALLFDNYQTLITNTNSNGERSPSEICLPLMKTLADECVSVYNNIPVIVCIYMGEALQSADMLDRAREHFKMSLQFYPNSIPLLVYNYKLEQDPVKKKEELAQLKKKYPKHWMVKDL